MKGYKHFLKKMTAFMIAVLIISGSITAHACTQFYFGKNTTDDGSYIYGRSEDISASYAKLFMVREAATHNPGDMYISSTGFTYPYPERTLRYTLVKDSSLNENITPEPYAEAGVNEYHVAVTASVTLTSVKAAITGAGGVDRMVPTRDGGISETDITTVLLMQATSARHACEIYANIVDTYGSATRDGVMISDPNEVWYFQVLSGHQYVAVKCPDDMIGYSPNITGNVDITDTENVIASPGLVSVPQAAGTLVTDANGNIKIADSYASSAPSYTRSGATTNRLVLGTYYLKGMDAVNALPTEAPFPYMEYFTAPRSSGNYSLYEAMRLLAFRGEGTPWYAGSATGNSTAIGNDGTVEAHVFHVRSNMPAALSTIKWLCMGPAEFGIYIPFYGSLITDVYEMYYKPDVRGYNNANPDNNSVYNVFRELYTLCKGPRGVTGTGSAASRARYGGGVKQFWERYQKSLIAQQSLVDADMLRVYTSSPALAELKATELSKAVSKEAYEYAKQMLAELKAFQAAGTEGDFIPSALLNDAALPHYATLASNVCINDVTLSASSSIMGNERTIDVAINTANAIDVTNVTVELVNTAGYSLIPSVMNTGVILGNTATVPLHISSSLPSGTYKVKVSLGQNQVTDSSQSFTVIHVHPDAPVSPAEKVRLNVEGMVQRIYQIAFSRDAESEGLKFWADRLISGKLTAAQTIEHILLNSNEGLNKNYSDKEFLKISYEVLFGRLPDDQGEAFWLSKLQQGYSRRWIMANMIGAPTGEFESFCIQNNIRMGKIKINTKDMPSVKR